MKKAPNPKIFLALSLGTLVVGVGANYMAYSGLAEAQGKNAQLQSQVKPTTTVQAELDKSNQDLNATATQLKYLEGGVPDFAYVPTMLAQLEKFGKENGLDVTGVRPTPPPPANPKQGERQERKPYDELIIEVKAHGKYADVMKFVSALQTFPKIVATRSITMTPKNDPNHPGLGALDVTIDLKAFVFPATAQREPAAPATGNGQPATTPATGNGQPAAGTPGPTSPKTPAKTGQAPTVGSAQRFVAPTKGGTKNS